jgi:hypothetical protein
MTTWEIQTNAVTCSAAAVSGELTGGLKNRVQRVRAGSSSPTIEAGGVPIPCNEPTVVAFGETNR